MFRPDDDLSRPISAVHRHFAQLDSTNARAMGSLTQLSSDARSCAAVALVTADRQSSGRGRMGRIWDSSGSRDLYASIAIRFPAPTHPIGALGLAVGLGLRRGIEAESPGLRVGLKWPNDLYVGARKLGGILIETRWTGDRPDAVIGFGINVGRERFEPPLDVTATSLAREIGPQRPGRRPLLRACVDGLERAVSRFMDGGFPEIRHHYEECCVTLGRVVRVPSVRPDGSTATVMATALRLDDDGALVVAPRGGGRPHRVESGDVWLTSDA
jgi:BirA family biotin operon repressor/biotin-[acetyl-CoA-carboxylase] ligase